MTTEMKTIPQAFIWRRVHSLFGLWLVIFLIEHLFINSQAALWIGDDGANFIQSANSLESWPYLQVFEVLLLGLPLMIHTIWGIKYLLTAKYNSYGGNGKEPYLPNYSRNHAYTWQRITSWILILGILAHVIHMRFIEHPMNFKHGTQSDFVVKIGMDSGLVSLAKRLNVQLYDGDQLNQAVHLMGLRDSNSDKEGLVYGHSFLSSQEVDTLKKMALGPQQTFALAKDFGTAELLMLRDTFKKPIMLLLYTLFVLAACYHAFNGLWTFMITWGITLSQRSQSWMLKVSTLLMIGVGLLGLSSIWITYWINLKQ